MITLRSLMNVLERTPDSLRAMLGGLGAEWTLGRYGEGTWSAAEVVGHLIVCERDDWMPRVRRIMAHGDRLAFDPFPHDATVGSGADAKIGDLLETFARERSKGLAELRSLGLSEADLARPGLHPSLGGVTLGQLLSTWAVHDLHHTRQIALAMAWQARDLVGPWRAYLNTLQR